MEEGNSERVKGEEGDTGEIGEGEKGYTCAPVDKHNVQTGQPLETDWVGSDLGWATGNWFQTYGFQIVFFMITTVFLL